MLTEKQKLIERFINRETLKARRHGFTGIDGSLRRQLNRATLTTLKKLWDETEKEK